MDKSKVQSITIQLFLFFRKRQQFIEICIQLFYQRKQQVILFLKVIDPLYDKHM